MNPKKFFLFTLLTLLLQPTWADGPWKRHTIDDTSEGADGVRLADVNGDGFQDIATGWEEGGAIRVYLNPGYEESKEAWPSVTVGQVGSPEDAVFVDLDRDGNVDVVSCCEGKTNAVFVHWAPADPGRYLDPESWTTETIPLLKSKQRWMYCLPFEREGATSLVIGAKGEGAEIGILSPPNDPRDLAGWKWRTLYPAGWIMSLEWEDLDADGDPDILFSDRRGENTGVQWLENPGSEEADGEWKLHRVGPEDEVMFLDKGDLDGDGDLDIVCAVRLSPFQILLREGESWECVRLPTPENSGSLKAVRMVDLNLDGRKDLVYTTEMAEEKDAVVAMFQPEDLRTDKWESFSISGDKEGIKFDLLEMIDLDGDGDLDVLTCAERENLGVIWYENPGF